MLSQKTLRIYMLNFDSILLQILVMADICLDGFFDEVGAFFTVFRRPLFEALLVGFRNLLLGPELNLG